MIPIHNSGNLSLVTYHYVFMAITHSHPHHHRLATICLFSFIHFAGNKRRKMGKQTLTVEQNNNQTYTGPNNLPAENQRKFAGNGNKTILYGWKKHCLYFVIFLLMVLISINLALTLWVLKVLEVSKVNGYFKLS